LVDAKLKHLLAFLSQKIQLTDYEKRASQRAKHRALIMQILNERLGLTTQQIVEAERECFGYSFLTDNRLRELRDQGWVEARKEADGLLHWYPKEAQF